MPLALINRRTVLAAMAVMGASLALPAFADAPESPDMPQPDRLTLHREWLVEDVMGTGTLDRLRVTLAIAEDGSVSGHSGCNRFAGKAMIDGDKLSFGPLAGTRMACPEAQMNLEQKYLGALEKVASFRIDDAQRKLVLLDGAGTELLRFAEA